MRDWARRLNLKSLEGLRPVPFIQLIDLTSWHGFSSGRVRGSVVGAGPTVSTTEQLLTLLAASP